LKILLIQTAFIGDVVLASPLIENLASSPSHHSIDFLLRSGNENLFENHPKLNKVIIWDKKKGKIVNLLKTIKTIRQSRYDIVINLHRFFSSGLISFFSGAAQKRGFKSNPFSFCYTLKIRHILDEKKHEVDRNLELIKDIVEIRTRRPVLYPTANDLGSVKRFKNKTYVCVAPASIWFTKQFPKEKWLEFIKTIKGKTIYLLGALTDNDLCEWLRIHSNSVEVNNLSGKLSFLESTALMRDATMNFVNDSAPLHLASSVNAPVTVIFCSTIPAFGFGPLSDDSTIVETQEKLDCRPCGLHGFNKCPRGHFNCAKTIEIIQLNTALAKGNK